jgi:hypothetical protein
LDCVDYRLLASTVRPLLDMVEAVMFGCDPRGAELHTGLTKHRKGQTLNPTESAISLVHIMSDL